MAQAPPKTLTLEAFLKQPETKPASEYVDGRAIRKPRSQGKHSKIQRELVLALDVLAKPEKIACAFPELRCTFGDRSIVPDISIFVWNRIPRNENREIANTFSRAPDWTIEILSPGQSQAKVTKNILHCLKHGTQIGWLIDPDEKAIFIYHPKQEIEVLDDPNALLPVPSFAIALDLKIQDVSSCLLL